MKDISYIIRFNNGTVSTPIRHVCFAWLLNSNRSYYVDNKYCPSADISSITVGPPDKLTPGMVGLLKPFDRLMKKTVLSKWWKESVVLEEASISFTFNPNTWSITKILMIGSMVRIIWESPSVAVNALHWLSEGYSADVSLYLGHFFDSDNHMISGVNTNHLVYKRETAVNGFIKAVATLVKNDVNTPPAGVKQSGSLYDQRPLELLDRIQKNRLIIQNNLTKFIAIDPYCRSHTISDTKLEELCNAISE